MHWPVGGYKIPGAALDGKTLHVRCIVVLLAILTATPAVVPAITEAVELPANITGDDGAPMRLIPNGEFLMGSPTGEGLSDERPQHRVRIGAFYMDTYEVTVARYEKFLDATGHVRPDFWPYDETRDYAERPVVGVDWSGAQAYCEWAGKRLPTEAEWEYAARGQDGRPYPWGDATPTGAVANVGKSWSYKFYKDRLEPVGSRAGATSPFGIHDMAGNVWEWVADWYDAKYYAASPGENPPGPRDGKMKVLRGGSWNFAGKYSRTASRLRYELRHRAADIGFRCARDVRPPD